MEYLRIGTEYYKIVERPLIDGRVAPAIVKWKRHTIVDDHGKEYIKEIPKYEGFTVQPAHIDYQKTVKGFYNRYMPLTHKFNATYQVGSIPITLKFLEHIFGDQLQLGLDYISILWNKPTQILPILCLVSEERNTGKTTFLNWLKLIFQDNMTINKNEDFRSRFNADWSEKLIVAIEEVLLEKREDSERIKNLSTAKTYKTEAKGKDKVETNFFGKFILCSNHERNFILVDDNEIRFWVRKIPQIDKPDPDLEEILKDELPYFLDFISNRSYSTQRKTRMWFTKQQIHTEALEIIKRGTKFFFETELILLLDEMFEDFEVDTINLSYSDLISVFKDARHQVSRREIANVVMDKWKIKHKNSSYDHYYKSIDPVSNTWQVSVQNKKGRYFSFEKQFIKNMLNC